ncbi:MAG TPA: glycoside hydrolase family 3 N-terminal domain-containing protein, partial [Thermodesulfovibrionales bacterium]|nr:glycoside hydrolase family 3 N-terminal domain-containing protein [Thermodesulfovibrionales bacterium]
MNPYSRLVPRLNGKEIEERFDYYLGLVKKGVAGFIIFGGELETVREGIRRLQSAADHPLIIASDLEQGLGQQIEGGTVFPPAMAIASAIKKLGKENAEHLLKELYTAFALEARYAGINTIFAPVLDVNTNPDNPIIATRAFGEDPETVSFFGCEMVKTLQDKGIIACGKHFPGHGDTEIDSHIGLPLVRKDRAVLEDTELVPFKRAISEGVKMIMLGHLSVPAIDPSEKPATISEEIISYLRTKLDFKGIVISDAMNMGALAGYDENEASLMALRAGVDIILHPSDPGSVASYLHKKNWKSVPLPPLVLQGGGKQNQPELSRHQRLSDELSRSAVSLQGETALSITKPFVAILKEDSQDRAGFFVDVMKERFGNFGHIEMGPD